MTIIMFRVQSLFIIHDTAAHTNRCVRGVPPHCATTLVPCSSLSLSVSLSLPVSLSHRQDIHYVRAGGGASVTSVAEQEGADGHEP